MVKNMCLTCARALVKIDGDDAKIQISLCCKWTDDLVKILIVKEIDNSMFIGKAYLESFDKYARSFNKDLQNYVKEMRKILAGCGSDIEFYLKNNEFIYKRKNMLLGKIKLFPTNESEDLVKDFITPIIKNNSILNEKKEELESRCLEFEKEIYKIIQLKQQLENKIYSCAVHFISQTNVKYPTKLNKNYCSDKDSVYDEDTDFSDETPEPTIKNEVACKKRKIESSTTGWIKPKISYKDLPSSSTKENKEKTTVKTDSQESEVDLELKLEDE